MNIGIIGFGKIGRKRVQYLGGHTLVSIADPNMNNPYDYSLPLVPKHDRPEELLAREDVDAVIIATPHNMLGPLTLAAVKAGKHVLVEKPGALTVSECLEIANIAWEKKLAVQVGYTLRFHPAVRGALNLVNRLGGLMSIHGYYGHGGRKGYADEWRFDLSQSGGGVLMDLGVHLIDLAHLFFGELALEHAVLSDQFWMTGLEDNALLLLRQAGKQLVTLEVSCTEWKNRFSLEIVGMKGKLLIEGLGNSYGPERLTFYEMQPEMGKPKITTWEYPDAENAMAEEFKQFMLNIERAEKRKDGFLTLGADIRSAGWTLKIVEEVYDHNTLPA